MPSLQLHVIDTGERATFDPLEALPEFLALLELVNTPEGLAEHFGAVRAIVLDVLPTLGDWVRSPGQATVLAAATALAEADQFVEAYALVLLMVAQERYLAHLFLAGLTWLGSVASTLDEQS